MLHFFKIDSHLLGVCSMAGNGFVYIKIKFICTSDYTWLFLNKKVVRKCTNYFLTNAELQDWSKIMFSPNNVCEIGYFLIQLNIYQKDLSQRHLNIKSVKKILVLGR